jgi:type II secretory pathway pseudopilin PulG
VAAFSLIELMFVVGIAATVSVVAIPQALASLDDSRTLGAARYLATRLQRTRLEAVTGNAAAALRISRSADGYSFNVYVDGNTNGVLSRDIQLGVDRAIQSTERLSDHFPGVDFGVMAGLPAVDTSSAPPGSDPIRLGSSDMATFAATGTATAGSLYILGRHDTQYVVRIFGETGKTRVLKFNPRTQQWNTLSNP